jgi:hypothetical protein
MCDNIPIKQTTTGQPKIDMKKLIQIIKSRVKTQ